MDGFSIESDGGFLFATAVSHPEQTPDVTYVVKSRTNNGPVKVETVSQLADLAGRARAFMLAGPDVTRFRIVMDDYTLVGVRRDSTFIVNGVDGFTGRVEQEIADISGGHFVNVVAVVCLSIAADDNPDVADLYPLADLICGTWDSKPYP